MVTDVSVGTGNSGIEYSVSLWQVAVARAAGRLTGDVGRRYAEAFGVHAWDRLVALLRALGPCVDGMSESWDSGFDAAVSLALDTGFGGNGGNATLGERGGRCGWCEYGSFGGAIAAVGGDTTESDGCRSGFAAAVGVGGETARGFSSLEGAHEELEGSFEYGGVSGGGDVSSSDYECGSDKVVGGAGGSAGCGDAGSGVGRVGVGCVDLGSGSFTVRGKNYEKNRAKRERARKAKLINADWRGLGGRSLSSLPSLAGTVCTVDTRTADEVEAANTLARRRVAENKLAEIRANRLIASYADVDKTAAIEKLQVVRLEERINTAKAKSQASYKKCDESLKSLGSTGSAGEFALKKQIKDTKKLEARLQYVHDQFAAVYPLLSQEAIDRANAVPEPKFPTDIEVFGDCPADYTEEEREAYYLDMNIEAGELF